MSSETLKANQKKIKLAPKRIVFVALILILILAGAAWFILANRADGSRVIADEVAIPVELVTTPSEREKGLSGRDSLATGEGMLFVFEQPSIHCFWMKDMKFNIDIVWMDQDGDVVHVVESAEPASYPRSFCPDKPASYVLEVNAGESKAANISTNSKLDIQIR